MTMVRPSYIARKARRAHERHQDNLRKQNLHTCTGCDLCSAATERDIRQAMGDSCMNWESPACNQVPEVCSEVAVDAAAQKTLGSPQQKHEPSLRSKVKQRLKSALFRGMVIIHPRHIALDAAVKEVGLCTNHGRLVYWTDCSRNKHFCCGIGIAYQSVTETWTSISWRVRGCIQTHVLEVYAIAKALEIAWKHCCAMEAKQRPNNIVIYSDCPVALQIFAQFRRTLTAIERLAYGEELVGPGIIASEELCFLEIEVELRYVPGHAGIMGNMKADQAAKEGAKRFIGKRGAARLVNEWVR